MTKAIGYRKRTPGTLHEVLTRAFAQAGGVESAADMLPGRTGKRLYEAATPGLEPRHETQLTYGEARMLTRGHGGVHAFAEDLALLAGGIFLPPIDAGAGTIGAQAGRAGREVGEAMAEVYRSLEDGVFTREEAMAVLPFLREAAEGVAELYRQVHALIEPAAPTNPSKP